MQTRALFLHAGGSKCGSSAIQAFLLQNAKNLQTVGVCYRDNSAAVINDYDVTSGNGVDLCNELASDRSIGASRRVRIREKLLAQFEDGSERAICSSENFSTLTQESWSELKEAASAENIALVICYYVRNLSAFLSSSYDQGLRHGSPAHWGEFLSQATVWEHFEALNRLAKVFPKDRLRVLSYDACKQNLVASFLQFVGVAGSFDPVTLARGNKRVVNRSLTNSERAILRRVNLASSDQYSRKLSRILLAANPDAKPERLRCDQADVDRLTTKFAQQIAWVNSHFFGGDEVVKLIDPEIPSGQPPQQSFGEELGAYRAAFEFLAEVTGSFRSAAVTEVADRLLGVDWENAADPKIPEDFDPFGYLLCNRDLLVSEIKPFRHYIDFGWRENRIWKVA